MSLQPAPGVPETVVGIVGGHGGRVAVALTADAAVAVIVIQPDQAGAVRLRRAGLVDLAQLLIEAADRLPPDRP